MNPLPDFGVRAVPPCSDCYDDGHCSMNCGPRLDHESLPWQTAKARSEIVCHLPAPPPKPSERPLEQIFYGYFEDPASETPDHEPPRDAPCLYCGKPVHVEDVRTHNLMYSASSYAKRSYFYRTHRTCDEKHGPAHALPHGTDHIVLEMIARNGD